jgi:serine/threonine-protein kinase
LRGERLTTASDVFSLGLILYELLVGAPAFPSASSLMSTLARAVEETNPTDPGSAITEAAAAARSSSLAQFRDTVHGDLARILLKALSHDPVGRYQSVAEFAADLDRFEHGRPVLARRQTMLYRAGKFVQRHRLPVAATLTVFLALVATTGYALHQQRQALEQARRAQVTNRFLTRLFQSINPLYGGHWDMRASELVDRSVGRAEAMLANEPASLAEFQLTIVANYLLTHGSESAVAMAEQSLASSRRAGDVGLEAMGLAVLGWAQATDGQCQAALASATQARSLADAHSASLSREWRILSATAPAQTAYFCGGDLETFKPSVLEAVRLARQIPDDSLQEESPPSVTKTLAMGIAAELLGCDEGRALRQELLKYAQGKEELRPAESGALRDEGNCLIRSGQPAQAIAMLRRSVEVGTAVFGPHSFSTQATQASLAFALAQSGRGAEAIQEAKAAVTNLDLSARFADARRVTAQALLAAGDTKDAVAIAREIAKKTPQSVTAQVCLFVAYVEEGQYAAAGPYRKSAEQAAAGAQAGSPLRIVIESALKQAAAR